MLVSRVTKKIQRLVEIYQKAIKLPTNKREKATFDSLFDVTPCKCYDVNIDREDCRCPIKIPLYEWGFYVDQKNERNMVIAGVDHHMSALLQKRNERAQLFDRKKLTLKKKKIEDDLELANTDLEIPENEDYETLKDVSIPEPGNFIRTLHRNNNQYPTLAEMANMFNSPNREVAALVNAALKDLNLLTTDKTLIHSKVYLRGNEQ